MRTSGAPRSEPTERHGARHKRLARGSRKNSAATDPAASARALVRKFRQHDESTLDAQYAVKDDETKFLATSREAASQLEQLFVADEAKSE